MAVIRIVTTKGEAWCFNDTEKVEVKASKHSLDYFTTADKITAGMWFYSGPNGTRERPKWRKILDIQKMNVPYGKE